jgi:hypothetical protein
MTYPSIVSKMLMADIALNPLNDTDSVLIVKFAVELQCILMSRLTLPVEL